jgi:hypothetical protein
LARHEPEAVVRKVMNIYQNILEAN